MKINNYAAELQAKANKIQTIQKKQASELIIPPPLIQEPKDRGIEID
jgi:hypothetical protein